MGLDQYAYVASKAGEQNEFYEGAVWDKASNEFINPKMAKPRELAYWRKHPNLQGWMERLAEDKGLVYNTFNGVELELSWSDIERLEKDITSGKMSSLNTRGFFFGEASDDYYRESDLRFVREAKAELFLGLKVFYNSSW